MIDYRSRVTLPTEKETPRSSADRSPALRLGGGKPTLATNLIAGALVALAMFLIRYALNPVVGQKTPFALGILGILLAAYYFRFWAGVIATLLMIVLGESFLTAENRLFPFTFESLITLGFLVAIGFAISIACDRMRAALDRVTEREEKMAESVQELSNAYGLLNSVLDNAPMLVMFLDSKKQILRASSGEFDDSDSWKGSALRDIVNQSADELDEAIDRVALTSEPSQNVEFGIRREGRDDIWFSANIVPVQAIGTAPKGVCVIAFDMSAKKAVELDRERALSIEKLARTEAERASRAKDEFVANLSHELRTPLTSILGWVELMRQRATDPEVVANGIDAVEKSGRLQLQMIEDLLDLSRIISGKLTLEKAWCDAAEIVDSVALSFSGDSISKGIAIKESVEDGIEFFADPKRLTQILSNLTSNAIKFSRKGQDITLEAHRIEGGVEFCVVDQGEGIDPTFIPHVFDRFRQGDSGISRRHGGLGLGLAIVKQLVEMHGGSISAQSEGLGKGSTFSIMIPSELPLDKRSPRRNADVDRPLDDDCLIGIKALLVEDDEFTREVICRLMESYGADVVLADCSLTGFPLLQSEKPDILLSDIGMPGEDGYEFLKRVRLLDADHGGRTPAIALTAFARIEDRREALRVGYQAHIAKPVDVFELVSTIRNLASSTTAK